MSDENPDNLPDDPERVRARDRDARALFIENLHYHATDMSELRRIAEADPVLAHKIVDNAADENRMIAGSYRLGLIVTAILAAVVLAGAAYIIVNIGWWQTIVFVLAMLGVSHVLRVVLTGEWSDTSWFARFLRKKSDDDSDREG